MEKEFEELSPGDFEECKHCCATLKQCYMMTSCIPCRCEVYRKHVEKKNEKQS